jgi:hypothetical protein
MKNRRRSPGDLRLSAMASFILLVAIAAAASDRCHASGAADGPEPGSPYTYVFDTGATTAEPLTDAAVAAKNGWKPLAEDDTSHKFAGDTVLLNDRLTLVMRGKAAGAELYAQGPSGPVRRAAVVPVAAGGGSPKLSAVRILENNPGAVMVEAAFQWREGVGSPFHVGADATAPLKIGRASCRERV